MLIEEILEFELRGLAPLAVHEPLKLGIFIFMIKQKLVKKIFERLLSLLFTAKMLQEAMYFTSPTWAKSLTKFNLKIEDFKSVLDLNCT